MLPHTHRHKPLFFPMRRTLHHTRNHSVFLSFLSYTVIPMFCLMWRRVTENETKVWFMNWTASHINLTWHTVSLKQHNAAHFLPAYPRFYVLSKTYTPQPHVLTPQPHEPAHSRLRRPQAITRSKKCWCEPLPLQNPTESTDRLRMKTVPFWCLLFTREQRENDTFRKPAPERSFRTTPFSSKNVLVWTEASNTALFNSLCVSARLSLLCVESFHICADKRTLTDADTITPPPSPPPVDVGSVTAWLVMSAADFQTTEQRHTSRKESCGGAPEIT